MEALTRCSASDRFRRGALALALTGFALSAGAGTLEQAKRMHDRLAGVPPSASVLSAMQTQIDNGNALAAANIAMENKAFYNATLKSWAAPWTNRDDNKFAPLNDYSATVIGIVRDGLDYRRVLFDDIIYVPGGAYGAYSHSNNNAYAALEAADGDMGSDTVLVRTTQSALPGPGTLPGAATAGIATTRAAARAFFIDGTNRAMFRFTLKNHLCLDLEQVQDITLPTDRIRQDVSRSPGGDSRIFMNTCAGCHTGMDPLTQAFAYYGFTYPEGNADGGRIQYTPGAVQPKYLINENSFIEGYVTPNDRWDNYWRTGQNTAIFGWATGSGTGTGAKSMLQELAYSDAFAVCSVKKVFKAVCLREPGENDRTAVVNGIAGFDAMLSSFRSGNYNLKQTFAQAAVYCSGD